MKYLVKHTVKRKDNFTDKAVRVKHKEKRESKSGSGKIVQGLVKHSKKRVRDPGVGKTLNKYLIGKRMRVKLGG